MEKNNNRRNRSVLKSYFQKGDVPTEQQFAELIDSVSNIVEDGQVTSCLLYTSPSPRDS